MSSSYAPSHQSSSAFSIELTNAPEAPERQMLAQASSGLNNSVKRLSLQMSASLHRAAKLAALEEEETLNSLMVGLLRRYLQKRNGQDQAFQQRSYG